MVEKITRTSAPCIKFLKVKALPTITEPNTVYYVKNNYDTIVKSYITDVHGVATPVSGENIPDGLVSVGDIILVGTLLTIVAPVYWRMDNTGYSKSTNTVFTIPLASSGMNRVDVIYGDKNNNILKLAGVQQAGIATPPVLPIDTISISYIYISDSNVAPPVPDLSGYALLNGGNTFIGEQIFKNDVTIGNPLEDGDRFLNIQGAGVGRYYGLKLSGSKRLYDNTNGGGTTLSPNNHIQYVDGDVDLSTGYQFKINGVPIGGGGGTVVSIVEGDGISVDNTDPENPIVSSTVDIDSYLRSLPIYDTTATLYSYIVQQIMDGVPENDITGTPYKGNGAFLYITQEDVNNSGNPLLWVDTNIWMDSNTWTD